MAQLQSNLCSFDDNQRISFESILGSTIKDTPKDNSFSINKSSKYRPNSAYL